MILLLLLGRTLIPEGCRLNVPFQVCLVNGNELFLQGSLFNHNLLHPHIAIVSANEKRYLNVASGSLQQGPEKVRLPVKVVNTKATRYTLS
jgi:hypothetical protein